jgi:hypothetical protein
MMASSAMDVAGVKWCKSCARPGGFESLTGRWFSRLSCVLDEERKQSCGGQLALCRSARARLAPPVSLSRRLDAKQQSAQTLIGHRQESLPMILRETPGFFFDDPARTVAILGVPNKGGKSGGSL